MLVPVLLLLAIGTITASIVRAPYIAYAPGSARSTGPLVAIPGERNYRSGGEVLFTTVSVVRPTYLQAVWGWIRADVDVYPSQVIQGDQSDSENRQLNLELMDESKLVAVRVALEQLGYEVSIKGSGALVVAVAEALPVSDLLDPGDTVTAIDGEPIALDSDLVAAVGALDPGDTVSLTVESVDGQGRREKSRKVEARLSSRPEAKDEPMLGVQVRTRAIRYEFPFTVKIDSEDVGGPSAGLAWTLAVLDRLTPGSLTGGRRVAVTGEIGTGGEVNEVGGVAQKAVAAEGEGADIFIVPTGEYDEAREHAGGMRVAKVDTLDDALVVLDGLGGNALDLGTPGDDSPGA
ncbi:MAG: PDZ domain-containing protein [Acidimicrobiales bacterium]